jgi:hypothetical protein
MTMRVLLLAAVALALTAACSEKPPRPDPEHNAAINLQKGSNATAERTLEQGESERMGI